MEAIAFQALEISARELMKAVHASVGDVAVRHMGRQFKHVENALKSLDAFRDVNVATESTENPLIKEDEAVTDEIEALKAIERDARTLLDEMDASMESMFVQNAMYSLQKNLKNIEHIREQEKINNTVREFMYAALDDYGVLDDDEDQTREDIFNSILHDMKAHGYEIVRVK
jgi:hypothetical protein